MHLRPDHAVHDLPTLHAFIRVHPLGVLTTSLPSEKFATLQCSHIPWVLDDAVDAELETGTETGAQSEPTSSRTLNDSTTTTTTTTSTTSSTHNRSSLGVLRGHIARANPQTAAMIEAVTDGCPASAGSSSITPQEPNSAGSGSTDQVHAQAQAQAKAQAQDHGASAGAGAGASTGSYLPGEVLIIFTSPVDHYITPHFYTAANAAANGAAKGADKDRDKARIAPTWNYAAVQVYGRMRVFHDKALEETGLFLQGQLSDLARLGEEGVMRFFDRDGHGHGHGDGDGPRPWTLDDAPAKYIALLKKNIVGMRVEITRVEGRFKVSQERPVGDREGVVDGLGMLGGRGSSAARRMAEFVREGRVV